MSKDIMLDLETAGTSSNAAILSIGACKFDKYGIHETFHVHVDLESAVKEGGVIEPATFYWWLKQSDEARNSIHNGFKANIIDALQSFREWIGKDFKGNVWGNGASFDNVILTTAYQRLNLKRPWGDFNDRCYRTIKNDNFGIKADAFEGTKHDALSDAVHQAKHVIKIRNVRG